MTLTVEHLSHRYGAKMALDDVSFSLGPGFTALLGPNGAGKSTLFGLLTRLFAAQAGQISVAGYALSKQPRAALARMGVVFQQPTLDLDLTVRRNLLYFAALHGLSGKMAETRSAEVLDLLGMAERAQEPVRNLNGGHRRRMEIARSMIHRPQVLLLDEPTVGLDAETRLAIVDHVHRLAQDGLTVLWATHLTDEIRTDDHLLILHQGRVRSDGRAADFAPSQHLQEAFLALTAGATAGAAK
ncbi:ABC transporter ATP-binding protein [Thioclava sp. FR2]|uniref:ABC transporter ATP-binding protein n=1 Tax=Thioclava sp. FR2 TaxID=3445780 RepID=UPI003EBD77D0